MMKQDLTNHICDKCHEVLEECQCEEAQKQANWHNRIEQQGDEKLLSIWQKGEVTL